MAKIQYFCGKLQQFRIKRFSLSQKIIMTEQSTQWFASWFDTPYYHLLYKDRNLSEAQLFMDNLTRYLNLPENGSILDLACGRGRHSRYLSALGYNVTGADLSENSIAFAKQFENEHLKFVTHDMCKPFNQQFDAVFNLFTSFGYFKNDDDNLKTIKAIKSNLNTYGMGVIDFMNVPQVINQLVPENQQTIEGITFNLKRYVNDGYVIKEITFTDGDQTFAYQERVKALTLADFETMFEHAGVYLLDVFGDYKLGKYHPETSERLVMIFK